jgi:sulfur transfer complex TusBCD TusB component (DsrH family)
VPAGVHIARDTPETYASIKKRLADIRARRAADIDARDLAKRTADASTITVTGTVTVNQTVSFPSSYQ